MHQKKEPANSGRDQGRDLTGRWRKGVSGNPAGLAKGTRHRATRAAEALLDGEAETLTRKAIELALSGDTTALRLTLERIAPPRKDRPVMFELPSLTGPVSASEGLAAITQAVAAGDLTPSEAGELVRLIEAFLRAYEVTELEQRVARLEAKENG